MHPRPNPMHLSPWVLVRFGEYFAEVNLLQQFLVPTASCVFALRWGTPKHGTSSRIAHESKTQSIEHADPASSQELVFVSSLLDANQFPCKHFEKSHEGKISQQASRFARNANHLFNATSLDETSNCPFNPLERARGSLNQLTFAIARHRLVQRTKSSRRRSFCSDFQLRASRCAESRRWCPPPKALSARVTHREAHRPGVP